MSNQYRGTWRIIEMEQWDQDYIDLVVQDLPYPRRPSSIGMNPWRVLERICRHISGRLSNSRGLSTHIPLRFEVISALVIARRARNGCDCLSMAKVTRAPEANVI